MKLFISADIEGTAGIVNWRETKPGDQYGYFAGQMTKEVASACKGAIAGGVSEILVRDAHDSARNLDPSAMPRQARLMREWTGGPACMMDGLDGTFGAAAMTGYHTCAGSDGNPLAHTMNPGLERAHLHGRACSEFTITAMYAAYVGVPVIFVSGDGMLCDMAKELCPGITAVATTWGIGGGAVGMHPQEANEQIHDGMERAVKGLKQRLEAGKASDCVIPLPGHFALEVHYREHAKAYRASFYPGVIKMGAKVVRYEADDYMDVLRFVMFCM